MKKLIAVLAFLTAGAFAQTVLLPTTLSAAVTTASARTIVVTSATNFAVGSLAYVDQELMDIVGVASTTITVRRGAGGTASSPHASSALVFVGTPSQFIAKPTEPQGSCTRSTELTLPKINTRTGVISDCLGGVWTAGIRTASPRFRIYSPEPGGTIYTSLNTSGTAVGATTLYCTEVNLPTNKLLTGIGVLNGTTTTGNLRYVVLYDSAGVAVANSALAGAASVTASIYESFAFTSKFYAVGPAQYFGCFQDNAGNSVTVRMAITQVNDNVLTKGQTGATFGTVPVLTVPTGFQTATGGYIFLY